MGPEDTVEYFIVFHEDTAHQIAGYQAFKANVGYKCLFNEETKELKLLRRRDSHCSLTGLSETSYTPFELDALEGVPPFTVSKTTRTVRYQDRTVYSGF